MCQKVDIHWWDASPDELQSAVNTIFLQMSTNYSCHKPGVPSHNVEIINGMYMYITTEILQQSCQKLCCVIGTVRTVVEGLMSVYLISRMP